LPVDGVEGELIVLSREMAYKNGTTLGRKAIDKLEDNTVRKSKSGDEDEDYEDYDQR
jgi:hypothetical protein